MSREQKRTQLQRLIEFTVQIRHKDSNEVVGTGIVASNDGKIITCAHVLKQAGIEFNNFENQEVQVFFPKTRIRKEKSCNAKILKLFVNHDDDIAILQINKPPQLKIEEIAVLGTAESSEANPFRSYGFRRLGSSPSGYAQGEIMGPVMPFEEKNFLEPPIELRTQDIRPGMSGSAVLDTNRNLVVGLVFQRWNPGNSLVNNNIAWAVDNKFLTLKAKHLIFIEE